MEDGFVFGFGDGLVGGDVAVEEGVEAGFGFALDDDSLGSHAMDDLAGSGGSALGESGAGVGAEGEGGVGAVGGEFAGGQRGRDFLNGVRGRGRCCCVVNFILHE